MLLFHIAAAFVYSLGHTAAEVSPPTQAQTAIISRKISIPPPSYAAVQSLIQQGNRYYYQGELEKAVQTYERAIRTAKTMPKLSTLGLPDDLARMPRLNGGVILMELKRSFKAVEWFHQALEISPKDPRILTALGTAEFHNKDFESAEIHFQAALNQNPKEVFALLGLGRVKLKKKRFMEAATHFTAATHIAPNLNAAYFWKAQALEADRNVGGAIAAYKRVVANDSFFVETRYALSQLYMRYGMFMEASTQLSRVMNADPNSKTLQELKLKLQNFMARRTTSGEGIIRRLLKRTTPPFTPRPGNIPTLRAAIGTNALGKPLPRYALEFECTTPFTIKDIKTGAILVSGNRGEKWHVHYIVQKPIHFEILNSQYRKIVSSRNPLLIHPKNEPGGTTIIYDIPQAHAHPWNAVSSKALRGQIELSPHPNLRSFKLVNVVDLESYTHGLLSAEMPIGSPLEALKAQSVVARSNALYFKNTIHRHRKEDYDVCDGEHCQVYNGIAAESERSRIVVEATRGRIVAFRGKTAQVLYSSNCGGHTQSGEEIQGWGEVAYWKAVPDLLPNAEPSPRSPWELYWWLRGNPPAYCMPSAYVFSSHYRWTRIVPAQALEEKLDRNERIGKLLSLRALRRSKSGHLNSILVSGTRRNARIVRETHIRSLLGIGSQRSALFSLETEYGSNGRPETFIFYGGGWGHGVGMCQSGAMGRAEHGQSYVDILKAYFPGTELGNLRY